MSTDSRLDPRPPDLEPMVEDLAMAPALCARRLYQLGAAMVAAHTLQPAVRKAQAALLRPLPRAEQLQFMRLLVTLLEAHGQRPVRPGAGPDAPAA